ncbi:EAL domain-containing protein [Bosea caraganae]|uniref:EAL domain-containing protein n=1 Tax=Bosea caraganae TaxID=2763117 RepID=A0A370KZG8_9HYPH|nr:EAL domain-containing protein [Bosea caraganae]RDJ20256.1 EAL domain-containing protein [Bosea caraganae]RDJ23953.1 EAL domain-containing protein [Bosea caraganae]
MIQSTLSIRAKLTLISTVFVIIVVSLATLGATRLLMIGERTEAIERRWLAGTLVLGELSNRIPRFRLVGTYRALAPDASALREVDAVLKDRRVELEDLLREYADLLGENIPRTEVAALRSALDAYFVEHDAWVAADTKGMLDEPARRNSSLHLLYRTADDALDALTEANKAESYAEVDATDRLVTATTITMVIASVAAVLFALWMMLRLRTHITQPLVAITRALSQLAAGDRSVQVPEANRNDEIGEMAKAFDTFRANAVALEEAHEATRTAQEHAQALARHDALTGLPNRRVFSAALQAAFSSAHDGTSSYWVLMIDLDRFKPINDLQGHPIGDLVLCETARRLTEVVRKTDTVARLGGDEFAIIAKADQADQLEDAMRLASRVISAIREPIFIGAARAEIGASIGIARCPADGADPEGMLRAADIAMYRAKRDGRGTYRFFEQSMDEELHAQAELEADLRKAVADGVIRPHYQPLVNLKDGRVYGFELLARWNHPERGSVPPDVFIPLLEHLGLIADLTWSILRQACREAAGWPKDVTLALNISPIQLKDPALPTQLLTILRQERMSPKRLEIEITESALVSDLETAKLTLTALQSIGVKVSLDDFGTGYSSLYHLREMKFDKVKIDRSFVQSMRENKESEKIVDAILSLAKSLDLPTVAEGIENLGVQEQLAERGCEFGQGYYFGKAMTAVEAGALLKGRQERRRTG